MNYTSIFKKEKWNLLITLNPFQADTACALLWSEFFIDLTTLSRFI